MHAVPKPREGSKRAKQGGDNLSRIDRYQRDKIQVQMPPNPAPHILQWLVEIGLTECNGMGESPISWREIHYWQQNTGVQLSAFEAKLIRELSVAYVAQKNKSDSENCPPPWAPRM